MSIADGEHLGKITDPDFSDEGIDSIYDPEMGKDFGGKDPGPAAPSDGPEDGGYGNQGSDYDYDSYNPDADDYADRDEAPEQGFQEPDSDPPPRKPQPPPPSPQPQQQVPRPRAWTEPEIRMHFGIERGGRRFQIDEFDDNTTHAMWPQFSQRVRDVANEFGVNPGLLLVNALTESPMTRYMNRVTDVRSYHVGLDYWESAYEKVVSAVPQARGLEGTPLRDATGEYVFHNENGEDTGRVMVFPNGLAALRAVAAYLKFLEIELSAHVGAATWRSFSAGTRFLLIRYAYNAGIGRAKALATRAASGENIILTTGPAGSDHPHRTGSIRAGQAIDWSARMGRPLPYDGP